MSMLTNSVNKSNYMFIEQASSNFLPSKINKMSMIYSMMLI